jgi:ATP-binding cassette subfamily C protein CydD
MLNKGISEMRNSNKHDRDPAEARLKAALAPEARGIARAGWLTVVASLLWIVMAAAVAHVLGTLVAGTAGAGAIALAVAVFTGAGTVRIALGWAAAAQLDAAADRVLARERAAVLAAQDRLSPRADRVPSAAVAAMLTDKLPHLVPFILRYRPAALRAAVVPLAFLLCALPLSWAVAGVLLVAGPLIPVFMALVGMAAKEASARQMEEIGSLSALLAERLAALTDIRLLDAGGRMTAEFETRAEGLRDRTMAVLRVAFLSSTVLELFSAIGVAMVAVYVGFALLGEIGFGAWATPLTLSQGVFLLMLAPEFFQPLRDLAAGWHDKAAALAVAREVKALEDEAPREILGEGGAAIALPVPRIALEGLGLGALSFPDLQIAPGEAVAFTGASGSGKSTLIALIGGLEQPDRGAVLLDGAALTEEGADRWRAQVAWVPQAAQFPAGSLRSGLLLGAGPGTDEAAIAAALRLASAEAVVARLPEGLETELGETGGGVSGGEARRLMLARAAVSGRAVVLADEPTADLDGETAAEVIAALRALAARGATVIVATHDMALAAAMDRRVALDQRREEAA